MMNEQQLENLCIVWFQETGWQFIHGPDIAPDSANPERTDYRQVPPDQQPDAIELVLQQVESLSRSK